MIFIAVFIVSITILLNTNIIYDNICVLISNQLLCEMSEEVGDDIIDINWGDDLDYCIHYKGSKICLEYRIENDFLVLLTGVYKYKIEKDNLYILSGDGQAVINRTGNALIFLYDSGKQIKSKKITYLSSENEFDEIHQRMFEYINNKIVFKNGIWMVIYFILYIMKNAANKVIGFEKIAIQNRWWKICVGA